MCSESFSFAPPMSSGPSAIGQRMLSWMCWAWTASNTLLVPRHPAPLMRSSKEPKRLLCKNGMVAPVDNPILLRRRHRGATDDKLVALLTEQLHGLREQLGRGLSVLHASQERPIHDVAEVVRQALRRANLPLRLLPSILEAFNMEPNHTAFGISQAMTLAAQRVSPEVRVELEGAASNLLLGS